MAAADRPSSIRPAASKPGRDSDHARRFRQRLAEELAQTTMYAADSSPPERRSRRAVLHSSRRNTRFSQDVPVFEGNAKRATHAATSATPAAPLRSERQDLPKNGESGQSQSESGNSGRPGNIHWGRGVLGAFAANKAVNTRQIRRKVRINSELHGVVLFYSRNWLNYGQSRAYRRESTGDVGREKLPQTSDSNEFRGINRAGETLAC